MTLLPKFLLFKIIFIIAQLVMNECQKELSIIYSLSLSMWQNKLPRHTSTTIYIEYDPGVCFMQLIKHNKLCNEYIL